MMLGLKGLKGTVDFVGQGYSGIESNRDKSTSHRIANMNYDKVWVEAKLTGAI